MKHKLKTLGLAAGLTAAALVLSACASGSSDNNSAANTVPDSAGVSSASFVAFILSLSQNDESSEPLVIRDNFAVPADETDNVSPIV
ncbi:MAG: hypothetical protein H7332_15325 [Bdellovibrionales bacterium]|nr:hypothetical protein [Ramlibacter sp.]